MTARRKWGLVVCVVGVLIVGILLVIPAVLSSAKDMAMTACIERLGSQLAPLDLAKPHVPSEDEKAFLAFYGLTVPGAEHWLGTRTFAGHRVAVHVFEPPQAKGTVLIAHGYYDHAGVWRQVIPALVADGYRVFIYDQPGHGLSDGERAGIDDFQTYVAVLDGMALLAAKSFTGDLHLVAHSMGAGVAADWLLQGARENVDRVVLLAPLFRSAAWGISRFGHAVIGRWFRSMPRKYRRNSGDAQFLAFTRADPLQYERVPSSWVTALGVWNRELAERVPSPRPVTVLQGDCDTTVSWKHNRPLLARLLPEADVHMVTGGQHQLMNETPVLRQQVIGQILGGIGAEDD
jgi:alpha-beta hydrolase superfamily lysophospholipase